MENLYLRRMNGSPDESVFLCKQWHEFAFHHSHSFLWYHLNEKHVAVRTSNRVNKNIRAPNKPNTVCNQMLQNYLYSLSSSGVGDSRLWSHIRLLCASAMAPFSANLIEWKYILAISWPCLEGEDISWKRACSEKHLRKKKKRLHKPVSKNIRMYQKCWKVVTPGLMWRCGYAPWRLDFFSKAPEFLCVLSSVKYVK